MKTTIKQTLTRMHKKVINVPVSKNSAAGARPTGAVKVSNGVSQERHLQRPNPKTAFCKKKKKKKRSRPRILLTPSRKWLIAKNLDELKCTLVTMTTAFKIMNYPTSLK